MADRPVIKEPGFEHGAKGYRNGCGCQTCRDGQRLRIAEQRENRRQATGAATEPPHRPGKVERTVRRELKGVSDCRPPWVETLHELAITTARAVDEAVKQDKIQSLPGLQGKLLDVLDRIRSAAPVPAGAKPAPSVGDEAEDFVNGLTKFGEQAP